MVSWPNLLETRLYLLHFNFVPHGCWEYGSAFPTHARARTINFEILAAAGSTSRYPLTTTDNSTTTHARSLVHSSSPLWPVLIDSSNCKVSVPAPVFGTLTHHLSARERQHWCYGSSRSTALLSPHPHTLPSCCLIAAQDKKYHVSGLQFHALALLGAGAVQCGASPRKTTSSSDILLQHPRPNALALCPSALPCDCPSPQ